MTIRPECAFWEMVRESVLNGSLTARMVSWVGIGYPQNCRRALMQGWWWVCDLDTDASLWTEWKRKSVASLGWEPAWIRSRPLDRRRLEKTRKKVENITPGDRIVAYLKRGRIGGVGSFVRVVGLGDKSWRPIGEGYHGRLCQVEWDNLPGEGMYSMPGEDIVPRRLPTVQRIRDPGVLKQLELAVRDPDTHAQLPENRYLVGDECRELHSLLESNLESIEEGLRAGPWRPVHEFAAGRIGVIDVIAEDREENAVIIEAKSGVADDAAVGQIARYMAWARLRLYPRPRGVRGILIAGEITPRTLFAASMIPNMKLLAYRKSGTNRIEFRRIPPKFEA